MRGLIRFIIRNHFLLLFLLYLTFSLILIGNFNNYQRSFLVNLVHTVNGNYSNKFEKLGRYFSLKEENLRLIEENRKLYTIVDHQATFLNDTSHFTMDSIDGQHYEFVEARVVNNSTNKKHNYLTIDKGSNQGVEKDMAVICDKGVVGIVKDVSGNYATVLSVLNLNFRLSAKFKNNNYYGGINWDGRNYQYVVLNEIMHHVPVALNDTVITSSFSNIFPEGILIGTVSDFSLRGNFYEIKVKLSTDFRNVHNVFVVNNLNKKEITDLQLTEND